MRTRDLLGKCGNNCGRCPGYEENLKTRADAQDCSDGWFKYLAFRLRPEVCTCAGCQTPDSQNPRLLNRGCIVRKCAVESNMTTCANCSDYPCIDLKGVFSKEPSRAKIAARLASPIPEKDYLRFIEPYEASLHLDEARSLLSPSGIAKAVTPPTCKVRIEPFPDDTSISKKELPAFQAVYRVLADIKQVTGVTYARQTVLEKRREFMIRLLWAFGLFGTLQSEDGTQLSIDASTYKAQKITSLLATMNEYFGALAEHGLRCVVVPLTTKKDEWLLPSGWLRGNKWEVRMSADKNAGGPLILNALKTYASMLVEKYDKKAFTRFSLLDMGVLRKNQRP